MPVIAEGRINGIDLCSIQWPINAQKIADAGFEFAYVKASQYSSTRDFRFDALVDQLRGAGLRVGAYHFCSHGTSPEEQAKFFYKASGGLGSLPGDLPPMVDWEFCKPEAYPGNHPKHCVDWLGRFLKVATALWYPDNDRMRLQRYPVVYTYPYYSQGHQPWLQRATELSKHPLAFASYKAGPDGKTLVPWLPAPDAQPFSKVPLPWDKWTLWQYSGNNGLKVPGIAADCDRQVFSGSSGDWAEFLGLDRPVHQSEFNKKCVTQTI